MTCRVLGIDPGTAATGYGVLEPIPRRLGRLVECGVVRTAPRAPLPVRLQTIYEGVTELIAQHHPDVVVVESVFSGKHVRSSLTLSHARGVILLAAAQAGIRVMEYSPATVKQAVAGRGRAAKPQIGYMVQQLLRLQRPPTPTDAADGVAVALAHLLLAGRR